MLCISDLDIPGSNNNIGMHTQMFIDILDFSLDNGKYKIDIGEDEPIEVYKLKIYKFDREERNVGEAPGPRR